MTDESEESVCGGCDGAGTVSWELNDGSTVTQQCGDCKGKGKA